MFVARTRSILAPAAAAVGLLALLPSPVRAQGCVASRMNAPSGCASHKSMVSGAMDTDGTSYYLPAGSWQTSFGYRWFRSHRHFVGAVEQNGVPPAERDRSGNEVVNHVHIPELSVSRGITNRLSLTADLPILIARRKNPPNATRGLWRTDAHGIGDMNVIGRYWLGNPAGTSPQNLSIGLGFKLPTGKDGVEDDVLVQNTATRQMDSVMRPVDQSIQPGDGGFGFVTELQAFKGVGEATFYASGSYLFNPKETNGVPTYRGRESEAIMSVADQYAARVGVGIPAPFNKRVGLSLSARLEGVPVEDKFGGSLGFRRPGYSIGIEPGVSYTWKRTALNISVPYLVRRVRPQSVPDKLESEARGTHVQGDAAFADYLVIVGFSRRF
jgi:hypothetical protein